MTYVEVLEKFGLPASLEDRDEIRSLLSERIELERSGGAGEEMLRVLCMQLFSIGVVDDALLIWEAKESSFDAGCGLDIQFVCGAGLKATTDFLGRSTDPLAAQASKYLQECVKAGDFADWNPHKELTHCKQYFGVS